MQNESQRRRTWHFFHISEIVMFGKLVPTPHGRAISRDLSLVTNRPVYTAARSYQDNYMYYLSVGVSVSLYFAYSYIECLIHSYSSFGSLNTYQPTVWFQFIVLHFSVYWKNCLLCFLVIRVRLLLNIVCFFSSRTNPCRDWLDEGKDSFANLEMSVICFMSVFRKNFSWNIFSEVI